MFKLGAFARWGLSVLVFCGYGLGHSGVSGLQPNPKQGQGSSLYGLDPQDVMRLCRKVRGPRRLRACVRFPWDLGQILVLQSTLNPQA